MEELIKILEANAQYETMIDRGELVDTLQEINAYARGKKDGITYMSRVVLQKLKEINEIHGQ